MHLIRSLVLVVMLALAFGPAHAEPVLAVYVEHGGKVIELHADLWSPLYDGLGDVIYTAWESDELLTPSNVDRVGDSLRMIGWRREGSRVIIYLDKTTTITLPESSMQFRMIERIISDETDRAVPRQTSGITPWPSAS